MAGEETPRTERHGEKMDTLTDMGAEGLRVQIHCCACWRNTDDMRERADLLHEAVAIVINGGALDVKNSAAFAAADEFLAKRFRGLTSKTDDRFRLGDLDG